ncbi:hypothetical protein KKF34_19115 [Myxococcota bacterium]|nr:hypothetical protein [Myxococcota bacterium]MBU1382850.1 hypothetical protein [Myxococcota bacterium]MBU1498999.1 hypothetical protein [Myxococcota bacterium]
MSNRRLISKGRSFKIHSIIQLGQISIKNAEEHKNELAAHGWDETRTQTLKANLETLGKTDAAKEESKLNSVNRTIDENTAKEEILNLIRKILKVVAFVTRDQSIEGINASVLKADKRYNSTPVLLTYVERIIPLIERIDTHLSSYFAGQKPSDLLRAALENLRIADTNQENARQNLPGNTSSVNELKGQILDSIDELNLIASIAFEDNQAIRSKFNKDLLNRRYSKTPSPAVPTEN